ARPPRPGWSARSTSPVPRSAAAIGDDGGTLPPAHHRCGSGTASRLHGARAVSVSLNKTAKEAATPWLAAAFPPVSYRRCGVCDKCRRHNAPPYPTFPLRNKLSVRKRTVQLDEDCWLERAREEYAQSERTVYSEAKRGRWQAISGWLRP